MIIRSTDGASVYYESQTIESPRGSVLIIHGMGEHCGRHDETAKFFHGLKFDVHKIDLRGHGRTPGTRGHFESLESIYGDLDVLFAQLVAHSRLNEDVPLYIFGHSLGGLIALHYSIRYQQLALYPKLSGLILSAPALAVHMSVFQELQGKLALALPKFLNNLQVSTRLNPADLTRDVEEQKRYTNDPLVHPWLTPGAYAAIQEGLSHVRTSLRKIHFPALVLLGGKDPIVDSDRILHMVNKIKVAEDLPIEVKVFHSFRHEPLHELRRERAYLELRKWVLQCLPRIQKQKTTPKKSASKKTAYLKSSATEATKRATSH